MMRRRRRIASKLDRLGLGMFGFYFSHIRERFRDDTRAFYVFPQRGAIGFFRTSLFFCLVFLVLAFGKKNGKMGINFQHVVGLL